MGPMGVYFCQIQWNIGTGWAKLNGANAVILVVVKHVVENFDNFWLF